VVLSRDRRLLRVTHRDATDGDPMGDLGGDVVGDLVGDVVGDVVGDLVGDVVGDVVAGLMSDLIRRSRQFLLGNSRSNCASSSTCRIE
jgi:outer membrane lipoprotein SlyB